MKTLTVSSGLSKGKSPKTFLEFLIKYEEARKDGWELPEQVSIRDFPRFLNEFCIVLHKSDVVEVVEKEVAPEDRKESIKSRILASDKISKEDLLWFAAEVGVEVPEDIKLPLKIRKHLKEYILKND